MPTFNYTAKRADGSEYSGTSDVPDRFTLFRQIRRDGGTIISVREERGVKKFSWILRYLPAITSVSTSDKITFARNLAAMVDAGLPISRALQVLERQMRKQSLQKIFTSLNDSIEKGQSLSDALTLHPKVFSPLFISMVRAGEESGGLADALGVVAEQMEEAYELKRKVRGAMMYPAVILTVMLIIGTLMLIYVVPTLSQTFADLNTELPLMTRFVIGASTFVRENFVIALVAILGLVFGFIALMRTAWGKRAFHLVVLHIPLIRLLVREINSARMARTLSSLLSAGVEVLSALEITHDVVQNSYFKDVLERAKASIQKGVSMSDEFAKAEHLYPPLVSEMIAVGEETGKLSEMLDRVAAFYENDVSQRTKDMSTIIEPFLMVVIGAAVGFFALAMISPIYSLTDSF